jgi:uncharacterized iron-regulated membrane protein
MPLRLLVRAAPLLLGAVGAALWLRRRPPERPALPAGDAPRQPMPAPREPGARPAHALGARLAHAPEAREIDIVMVVDDLLGRP